MGHILRAAEEPHERLALLRDVVADHGRSELAADRFEEAVARTLDDIAAAPERGIRFGRKHRCRLVKRFPYHIVHRTERQPILIVAGAHGRRRPRYWRNRR